MRTHWRTILLVGTILSIICARAVGAPIADGLDLDLRLVSAERG